MADNKELLGNCHSFLQALEGCLRWELLPGSIPPPSRCHRARTPIWYLPPALHSLYKNIKKAKCEQPELRGLPTGASVRAAGHGEQEDTESSRGCRSWPPRPSLSAKFPASPHLAEGALPHTDSQDRGWSQRWGCRAAGHCDPGQGSTFPRILMMITPAAGCARGVLLLVLGSAHLSVQCQLLVVAPLASSGGVWSWGGVLEPGSACLSPLPAV